MGEKIFISYRRSDTQDAAGRLYDQLEQSFTKEGIFLDVDGIPPGDDFVEALTGRVAECDILLAVVGRQWTDAVDQTGKRRLENPNDWVRVEIESAIQLKKRIIPILVGGAKMPIAEGLPASLIPLTRRQAMRLTHERFKADVRGVIDAINTSRKQQSEAHSAPRSTNEQPPGSATGANLFPAVREGKIAERSATLRKVGVKNVLIVAVVVGFVLSVLWFVRFDSSTLPANLGGTPETEHKLQDAILRGPKEAADRRNVANTASELPSELDDDLTIGDPEKDFDLKNRVVTTRGHHLKILAKKFISHGGIIVASISPSDPAPSGATGSDGADGQRGGPGGVGTAGAAGSDAKEVSIAAQTFYGDLRIDNSGGAGQDGGNGGGGGRGGANIEGQPVQTLVSGCKKSIARAGSGGSGGNGANVGVGGDGGRGGAALARRGNGNGVVGGDGGNGGVGGDGGHGGIVYLTFDTMTPDSLIKIESRPGRGGNGGAGGDVGRRGPGPPCKTIDVSAPGPTLRGGDGGDGGASLWAGNILIFVKSGAKTQSAVGTARVQAESVQ